MEEDTFDRISISAARELIEKKIIPVAYPEATKNADIQKYLTGRPDIASPLHEYVSALVTDTLFGDAGDRVRGALLKLTEAINKERTPKGIINENPGTIAEAVATVWIKALDRTKGSGKPPGQHATKILSRSRGVDQSIMEF